MKTVLLVNPAAGRGAGLRTWRRIEPLIQSRKDIDLVMPSSPAETRKAAAQAVRGGAQRLVVVGGDGTLSAVAGELVHSQTALGIIPAGTGNDFCRNSGIERHAGRALATALEGPVRRVDVGDCGGGSFFLNAAGIGFDAEVAASVARLPRKFGGTVPYVLGALSTMWSYRPVDMEITVDQRRYFGRYMLVAVANGSGYGGGMQIAPYASTNDGQMDVCMVGALSRLELVSLLSKVYSGGHLSHANVQVVRGTRVRLHSGRQIRAHLDGEPRTADSMEIRVLPGALSVAMPPGRPASPDWLDPGYSRVGTPDSLIWWDQV